MKAVFADAGYWIAALDEDDQLHNTARRIVSSLGEHRIITTEMTLVETLNHMSGLGEYKRRLAYEGVSAIRTNPNLESARRRPVKPAPTFRLVYSPPNTT